MYNTDTDMATYPGSNKRTAAPTGPESTKKRAPYVLRACDACRRRKGRCSGDNPCAYCVSRSLECDVAAESSAAGLQSNTPPPSVSSRDSRMETEPNPALVSKTQQICEENHSRWDPNTRMLSSIGELVANLQEQVSTLTSKMNSMERSTSSQRIDKYSNSKYTSSASDLGRDAPQPQESPGQQTDKRAAQRRQFCGPTSPDYSLNMAQMRMQQGDLTHRYGRPRLPSIDDNQIDDEYLTDGFDDDDGAESARLSGRALERLTGFKRLLTQQESVRLMYTYQAVFGDFHPIVDLEGLVRQVETWYEPVMPAADEYSLLVVNLTLAVALCAEPTSEIDIAKTIYSYCRDGIGKKLVSPTPKIRNAVILLLIGTYHFFKDDIRFAWRMCGLAGNMLLELGLHSRDVPEHILGTEHERSQVVAIICTTIVLDRQWSAATGLPTHFQESHFHQAMKSSVESPYLKAMVSFMSVSDKFTSPISRVADTGQAYEEDDNFSILNFQIDQWRKNAVGNYNFTQQGIWNTTPISRIPSWAVLLNLRANAAHSMLLRPFFFGNKLTAASKKSIEPAVHLISDTINILSNLDKSTEVYRKQQPFYVHLLASACALMSLVIAHITQNHAALAPDLPEKFEQTLSNSFRKAFNLAKAYNTTSRASRKLWKRLLLMREPLVQLNILPRDLQQLYKPLADSVPRQQMDSRPTRLMRSLESAPESFRWGATSTVPANNSKSPVKRVVEGDGNDRTLCHTTSNTFVPDFSMLPGNIGLAMSASDGAGGMNNITDYGALTPTFLDWPFIDGKTFFSEGELLYEE